METHEQGRLEVEVTDHSGGAIGEEVLVLLSENKAQFGKQLQLKSKKGAGVSGEFLPGAYTLQALAKGYDVGRDFVEIHANRTHKVALRLKKGAERPRSPVTERLEKIYGIKRAKDSLQSLTVARGQNIVLDYRQYPDQAHVQVLRPKSLKDLKRWVGSPEGVFVGDHPRYGSLPSIQGLEGQNTALTPDQQASLTAIANEYVYGNAQAVPTNHLKSVENAFAQVATVFVPIFYYSDVVIEDGATLTIGNGSSVFTCDTLTIHPRGTLAVVGSVRADIGMLQQL